MEENLLHFHQSFAVSSDKTKFGNGTAYIQEGRSKLRMLHDRKIVHVAFSHMYSHILAIAYSKPANNSGKEKSRGEGKSDDYKSPPERFGTIIFSLICHF